MATFIIGGKVGKRKVGRPKLKSGRRSRIVKMRVSSAEYRKLKEKADAAGLTVSEFLRQQAKD